MGHRVSFLVLGIKGAGYISLAGEGNDGVLRGTD